MRVCVVLSSFKNNESFLTALLYCAYSLFSAKNEVNLILIDEGVKYAEKGFIEKVKIDENIKHAFYYQTSFDISKVSSLPEFVKFLKNNFRFNVKVCNTSSILYGLSKGIGDRTKFFDEFELTTLYDIYTTIISSSICIYL